ncbi:MAG: hypothetical protein COU65_01390 [Candidatus Pacebacteria bacterium CG10_big_fil_rev_8_21_14_0_10_42_12]|nr:MAG: hypothetical protein COU65_01390 [Candidatus Pacebacteria bacterium CG10_big_fil_rev_8_21_14_0_10_42_12]
MLRGIVKFTTNECFYLSKKLPRFSPDGEVETRFEISREDAETILDLLPPIQENSEVEKSIRNKLIAFLQS